MPAVTQAAIRDTFISPRPPYLTGALASAGGTIYEGLAYCTMSQFLTLCANGKTLKFSFFVLRVYYEKLGQMLKLGHKPEFRPDLSARFKDITEKQVPAMLRPIVGKRNTMTIKSSLP